MPRVNDYAVLFGKNARKAREALGLSQAQLAAICGFHPTYIGMVERAERNISLANAYRIAKALGQSLDALLETHD